MKNMKGFLGKMENEALHELAFTYERPDHVALQAEILAHRTPKEINRYLHARVSKLRQICGGKRSILHDELYVVFKDNQPSAVDCAYVYGETYHNPPLVFPTEEELRMMWSYAWTIAPGPFTCEFDRFFEKQVFELLKGLHAYESLLEGDIILLPYALRSQEGAAIHNALYAKAKETLDDLCEKGELFLRSRAPQCMQAANSKCLHTAREILQILGSAKVPNLH